MIKARSHKRGFNQAQVKATAQILLELVKSVTLAILAGILFPGISGKIRDIGIFAGVILVAVSYVVAILLLREVDDLWTRCFI